jgi:hypothetical protein
MNKFFRSMGWIALITGLLLDLLGVLALPDGGLFFALPYFFLIPGMALTAAGGLLAFLARSKKGASNKGVNP